MTPLEQLVQDWLELDKVRIFSTTKRDIALPWWMDQSEETSSEIRGLWESGNREELESRLRCLSIRLSICHQAVISCSKEEN